MNNDARHVWESFRHAYDSVASRLHADLGEACDISLSDFEILSSLYDATKNQLRMSQLATMAGMSPSGLTRRFDSLVNRGLVTRTTCDDDRRGVVAELTKDGARVVRSAAPVFERGAKTYFIEPLGDKSVKSLGAAMDKVTAANVPA